MNNNISLREKGELFAAANDISYVATATTFKPLLFVSKILRICARETFSELHQRNVIVFNWNQTLSVGRSIGDRDGAEAFFSSTSSLPWLGTFDANGSFTFFSSFFAGTSHTTIRCLGEVWSTNRSRCTWKTSYWTQCPFSPTLRNITSILKFVRGVESLTNSSWLLPGKVIETSA